MKPSTPSKSHATFLTIEKNERLLLTIQKLFSRLILIVFQSVQWVCFLHLKSRQLCSPCTWYSFIFYDVVVGFRPFTVISMFSEKNWLFFQIIYLSRHIDFSKTLRLLCAVFSYKLCCFFWNLQYKILHVLVWQISFIQLLAVQEFRKIAVLLNLLSYLRNLRSYKRTILKTMGGERKAASTIQIHRFDLQPNVKKNGHFILLTATERLSLGYSLSPCSVLRYIFATLDTRVWIGFCYEFVS